MKKSLFVVVLVCAMGAALAHGPPSALDSGVVAQVGDDLTRATNFRGSGSTTTSHSGWIRPAASVGKTMLSSGMGVPPNERMLN
jgi:hypothetical protein